MLPSFVLDACIFSCSVSVNAGRNNRKGESAAKAFDRLRFVFGRSETCVSPAFDIRQSVHFSFISPFSFRWNNFSVFGEDALVNVSVEKKDDNDGKLAGYIRIRSKTQGIALSLGDRITSVQRGLPEKQ